MFVFSVLPMSKCQVLTETAAFFTLTQTSNDFVKYIHSSFHSHIKYDDTLFYAPHILNINNLL